MSTVERTRPKTMLPPLVAASTSTSPHSTSATRRCRRRRGPSSSRGVVYMPSPMRLDHGKESRFVAGWLDRYEGYTPGVGGADGATVKLDPGRAAAGPLPAD